MTPAEIIKGAESEGVILTLSDTGTIRAEGADEARNRWRDLIREHKAGIVDLLKGGIVSLTDLIKKRSTGFATAIPAIPATDGRNSGAAVARIATIAVAKARSEKAGADAPSPMTDQERAATRAWLSSIGESDPDQIAEVLANCERDESARACYLGRAAELPPPVSAAQLRAEQMLVEQPGLNRTYAVVDPDTDPVVVGVAVRGRASCTLLIPASEFSFERMQAAVDKAAAKDAESASETAPVAPEVQPQQTNAAAGLAEASTGVPERPEGLRAIHQQLRVSDGRVEDGTDDRIRCIACQHLSRLRGHVCTIAKPGGIVSAREGYQPQPVLQRCAGFAPLPGVPDQRTGAQRWPWLVQS